MMNVNSPFGVRIRSGGHACQKIAMPGSGQLWMRTEPMDQSSNAPVASKKNSRATNARKPAVNQTLSCAECRRSVPVSH